MLNFEVVGVVSHPVRSLPEFYGDQGVFSGSGSGEGPFPGRLWGPIRLGRPSFLPSCPLLSD